MKVRAGHARSEDLTPRALPPLLSLSFRAYKLGKGKCSYNMVKLDFLHELTPQTKSLSVVEATETRAGAEDGPAGGIEESMLSYELTLNNKSKVLLNVYVVYSVPTEEVAEDGKPVYTWKLVKRGYCKRGCKGPILKAIQRFGKLGRRCSEIWSSTNYNTKQLQQAANSKDHRFLFISIDEACTHVAMGDKKTRFRLLFSVDDASTGERIGSAVSAPIRVLANNDAPNGTAYFNMPVPLTDGWEGWDSPLALRQRTVLPEAMTENAPTTPDGSAGSGASDSDILPGFATKRSRGSNKGAAAAAGRWRAGDAAAGPIHPKKRAKQLAASGILSDASNILITPMSTKVKVEKGSPLAVEGPQTPSPTSIETVRASMTSAMLPHAVLASSNPISAVQLFSPQQAMLNVPAAAAMFSPGNLQVMAYLQAMQTMQAMQQQQGSNMGAGAVTAEKK